MNNHRFKLRTRSKKYSVTMFGFVGHGDERFCNLITNLKLNVPNFMIFCLILYKFRSYVSNRFAATRPIYLAYFGRGAYWSIRECIRGCYSSARTTVYSSTRNRPRNPGFPPYFRSSMTSYGLFLRNLMNTIIKNYGGTYLRIKCPRKPKGLSGSLFPGNLEFHQKGGSDFPRYPDSADGSASNHNGAL